LTAHVRGGATHWIANAVIGGTLLAFAIIEALGGRIALDYPRPLLARRLVAIGFFHLALAKPTFAQGLSGKLKILTACGVIAATQNMLYVLGAGIAIEGLLAWVPREPRAAT
jgi:hypothetical protein